MMCVMHDSPEGPDGDGRPKQSQLNRQELQRIALLTEQVRLQQHVMAFTMAAQASPQIQQHTEVLRAKMQQRGTVQQGHAAAESCAFAGGAARTAAEGAGGAAVWSPA